MTGRMYLCAALLIGLAGCASTTKRGKAELEVGMTTAQVRHLLGTPDDRSFRENNEAWQYHDVVGYGQCEYLTAWFTQGILHAVTTRRGASIAGCGLGSMAVDWGQMPKPSIDVNISTTEKPVEN